jgi:carboxylesterase type B
VQSLPELFAESNTTGNYALQDQTFAFKWVHDNAAALGADLTKVFSLWFCDDDERF